MWLRTPKRRRLALRQLDSAVSDIEPDAAGKHEHELLARMASDFAWLVKLENAWENPPVGKTTPHDAQGDADAGLERLSPLVGTEWMIEAQKRPTARISHVNPPVIVCMVDGKEHLTIIRKVRKSPDVEAKGLAYPEHC